ncbi:MAG TPA: hypothetical protein VF221_08805, partial [Chloroflexota bacterium]
VVFYIIDWVLVSPPTAATSSTSPQTANLILQTVGAYGSAPNPDWVTYFERDPQGQWEHTTYFTLPAHATINVTIYQYDSASGLRNPLWAQARGTQGGTVTLNNKTTSVINPADAAHTFAIPDLGVSVPLKGIDASATNPCPAGPCDTSFDHNTIKFSFTTGAPGEYRWQCFVPCGAGTLQGFGGPMQTLGYMDGEIYVR